MNLLNSLKEIQAKLDNQDLTPILRVATAKLMVFDLITSLEKEEKDMMKAIAKEEGVGDDDIN